VTDSEPDAAGSDPLVVPAATPAGHGVVVAGAGSGIGRAVAEALSDLGCRVACLDVNLTAVQDVAARLGGRDGGGDVFALPVDVSSADSVREAIDAANRRLGGVQALVNCVGITGMTNLRSHEVPIDDFDRVVAVNLRGALLLSQAVLPGMVEREYGRILQVASIAGKEGNAGMVSYSATKAGLIGMVKAQGKEYALTGVTVNALAPAVIYTPMVDAMPAEQVRYMTERIPMARLGHLGEIAALICFAISPAAGFVTGFTWDMSGGRATY
jgi:2-dehydro-3-deoxy-L-rhamnonate dehydrogenase (NAD+)